MTPAQPGILEPIPAHARHLIFDQLPAGDLARALAYLQQAADGRSAVVGLGYPLLESVGCSIKGMQMASTYSGAAIEVPATPGSLWVWLRAEERGEVVEKTRQYKQGLECGFELGTVMDCFRYRDCRDLSGYIDGSENPEGENAHRAAFVDNDTAGLKGSSFASVQQWLHNLTHFKALPQSEQDNIMGRRMSDNEEFDEAPESAHVKRSAPENFSPEAFMLRRSMPWSKDAQEGLVFLGFGHSLQAFDRVMKRMVGMDDGITDALFRFSQPISGTHFWCPPMLQNQIDLSLLKLDAKTQC